MLRAGIGQTPRSLHSTRHFSIATLVWYVRIASVTSAFTHLWIQVENLYSRGARSFAFINIPPIERAPLFIEQGVNTTVAIKASLADYNQQFSRRIAQFRATHRSLDQVVLFDASKVYNVLLDNASTLGLVNATGYCQAYQNGTPSPTAQLAGCAPVSQYL